MIAWNLAMRAAFLLALAIATALPAAAQVYKWTDGAGHVHYGDKPPEGARSETLRLQVKSYDGPPQVMDWASVIRKKSPAAADAAQSGVVMYSTSWCPHCKRARAYFASHGIAFEEIDVEKSEAGRRAFKDLGGGGVPLILVGGKAMRGFSEKAIEGLLRR